MKKRIFGVLICVILVFAVVTLTACSSEKDAMQALIDTLENENEELKSTVSSLRGDLEIAQIELTIAQTELQNFLSALQQAQDDEIAATTPSEPLAITFYGVAHTDRSWPLSAGVLEDVVALHVNWDEFDDDLEIYWESTNENVFTVVPSDDGMSARVTPEYRGAADIVVTLGNVVARATIRIT